MPGPKPTPTSVLAGRGSWRANERANEPMPELADIEAPAELSERARETWERIAPRLFNAGLLTSVDIPAFARYCRLSALLHEFLDELDKARDRKTVLTVAKLEDMLRRIEANFGMTPADRAGLNVQPAPKGDGKDRFFKAG